MMKTRVLLTLAAGATVVMTLSAQAPPDFSGRWTTDPDPAQAAGQRPGGPGTGGPGGRGGRGDMGSGWGPTITITQNATALTVEYAFFARGDMQPPLKFTYALNGTDSKNSVRMGRGMQVQTSKAVWQGQTLAITTIHTFPDPATGTPTTAEVKQVLSLESPTSLVVEATRSGVLGGPPVTTRTVYRKV